VSANTFRLPYRLMTAFAFGACLVTEFASANAPDIAEHYCATCHEVTPGVLPRNPGAGAPSFLVIANDPRMGSKKNLYHVITQSHASMPPISLTATERQELIGYIRSYNTRGPK
jgi:hypothetical protein